MKKNVVGAVVGNLRRDFRSMEIGQVAKMWRVFHESDLKAFAELTGDFNRMHLENDADGNLLVHGMLCASMIPALFAERIPGSIYWSQELNFRKPVFVGERVSARIEVQAKKSIRGHNVVKCLTEIEKTEGIVIEGIAKVLIP